MSLIRLKTLWEKERMLVTSIFSFSLNVFKRFFTQDRKKSAFGGIELTQEKYNTTSKYLDTDKGNSGILHIFTKYIGTQYQVYHLSKIIILKQRIGLLELPLFSHNFIICLIFYFFFICPPFLIS